MEHVFKRHVTLRPVVATTTLKAPEQRVLGDSGDWDEMGTEIRQEGDGLWRSGLPLQAGTFVQAMSQWKWEGPSQGGILPPPTPDAEVRFLDPLNA